MSLSYLPQVGGLVSYMRSVSNHVVDSGGGVRVYTTNSGDHALHKSDLIDSVLVDRVDSKIKSYFFKLFTPFIVSSRIREQIKKDLPSLKDMDLIVVRHIYYAYALLEFDELRGKSVFLAPLLAFRLEIINSYNASLIRWFYGRLVAVQLYYMEKKVFKTFDKVAVLSSSKRDEINAAFNLSEDRLLISSPGVDMNRFYPEYSDANKCVYLKKLDKNYNGEYTVLTVCRLVEEKNVAELIKAIKLLSFPCKLYVVGDGPQREKLETLAYELGVAVIFFGARKDVEIFYRVVDCFVLASFYEGFGHVYLEALSSGCPVIGVSNNPPETITASDEIIKKNEVGEIALSPKANDLSESITNVRSNARDSTSKICREYVEETFSWQAHLDSLICFVKPSV